MDTKELLRSKKGGKKGGRRTLAKYGKAHFIKAAKARWRKHRKLAKMENNAKTRTQKS